MGPQEWVLAHCLMIAFITCKSSFIFLLEGLCSSGPCTFEFSIFEFLPEYGTMGPDVF